MERSDIKIVDGEAPSSESTAERSDTGILLPEIVA